MAPAIYPIDVFGVGRVGWLWKPGYIFGKTPPIVSASSALTAMSTPQETHTIYMRTKEKSATKICHGNHTLNAIVRSPAQFISIQFSLVSCVQRYESVAVRLAIQWLYSGSIMWLWSEQIGSWEDNICSRIAI